MSHNFRPDAPLGADTEQQAFYRKVRKVILAQARIAVLVTAALYLWAGLSRVEKPSATKSALVTSGTQSLNDHVDAIIPAAKSPTDPGSEKSDVVAVASQVESEQVQSSVPRKNRRGARNRGGRRQDQFRYNAPNSPTLLINASSRMTAATAASRVVPMPGGEYRVEWSNRTSTLHPGKRDAAAPGSYR